MVHAHVLALTLLARGGRATIAPPSKLLLRARRGVAVARVELRNRRRRVAKLRRHVLQGR